MTPVSAKMSINNHATTKRSAGWFISRGLELYVLRRYNYITANIKHNKRPKSRGGRLTALCFMLDYTLMDRKTRDRMIDIASAIKMKREELAVLERELDSIMDGSIPRQLVTGDATASQRVQAFIEMNSGNVYEAEEIASELGVDVQVVRTNLSRLSNSGQIRKVSRGKYQAIKPQIAANGPYCEPESQNEVESPHDSEPPIGGVSDEDEFPDWEPSSDKAHKSSEDEFPF